MVCYDRAKSRLCISIICGFLLMFVAPYYPLAQGGYDYLSTGIGMGAREGRVPQDYTVKIVFSSAKGELLASVKVNIAEVDGEQIFSVLSEGPWLYVDLPQGLYNIEATFRNCVVKREGVKISSGFVAEVIMRWNLEREKGCD